MQQAVWLREMTTAVALETCMQCHVPSDIKQLLYHGQEELTDSKLRVHTRILQTPK